GHAVRRRTTAVWASLGSFGVRHREPRQPPRRWARVSSRDPEAPLSARRTRVAGGRGDWCRASKPRSCLAATVPQPGAAVAGGRPKRERPPAAVIPTRDDPTVLRGIINFGDVDRAASWFTGAPNQVARPALRAERARD